MADHDTHDHTGIPGVGAPTEITDIPTAEMDDTLVLAPDGAGGVEFRAEAAGGSGSGTSFPGSPSTNDRFFRTDRGVEYYYDGTRWLSLTQFLETLPGVDAATGAGNYRAVVRSDYQIWVVSYFATMYAGGLTGSAYWTSTLEKRDVGDTTSTTLGAVSIQSGTSANWLPRSVAVGAAVDASTHSLIQASTAKVGSPGNLYIYHAFTFRLIG